MFKWDKNEIKELIKYLKTTNTNLEEVQNDLEILYFLKKHYSSKKMDKLSIKENLLYENNDYEQLKKYDEIIDTLIEKYTKKEEEIILKPFKKISTKKEDIFYFTCDNLYKIDKNWGKTLEPYIFSNYTDIKKGNGNNTSYLGYLNKFFISLSKNNNISDFITPTHEYLHVYHTLLNNKSYETIEAEFLSFLGEFITSYEIYKNGLYSKEIIKANMENYITFINYLKSILMKRETIFDEIKSNKKIQYIYDTFELYKTDIKNIYTIDLNYNYTYSISYILALELFELYLKDKEKCIYISENIIKSNKPFEDKIKENKIELLTNDDKFIKQLKKEYINL